MSPGRWYPLPQLQRATLQLLHCLFALAVSCVHAGPEGVEQPASLGGLRLFFTADERQALDTEQLEVPLSTAVPLSSGATGAPAAAPGPRPATPQEAMSLKSGRDGSVATVPVTGFTRLAGAVIEQPVDRRSPVVYTGLLRSDQGDTWLFNGLPWRPGWMGIRTVRAADASGQVIVEFDDGAAATLSPGDSVSDSRGS